LKDPLAFETRRVFFESAVATAIVPAIDPPEEDHRLYLPFTVRHE
jgi:hypothetical protein